MNYYEALKFRKPVKRIPEGMTRERALQGIAAISEQLRAPMPNLERILLVHDRDDLKDIIALMDAAAP